MYQFIQDKTNTFASTIVPTNPFTAGNTVIVNVQLNAAGTAVSLSDGVNTWTPLGNITPGAGANNFFAFYCIGVAAGSPTITSTPTGGTNQRIYLVEYSGILSFIASSTNFQNGPGTGANVIVGGNINVTSQPALLWGFCQDASGTEVPTAGTSPIAFSPELGSGSVRAEDTRILVTGNAQVTFGNTSSHAYTTISGAFIETPSGAPQCGRTIYILP